VKIVRGLVARHRKEFAEAERFFEQIYSQSPGDFLASNQLALSLADQDDPAKQSRAQQLADVNVRQYPRNAEALATAGWVNYRQGKLEAAERLLNTAVSGGRASSDIAYFIARVKIDQGQLNAAQSWLEQALNSDGAFVYRDDARARLKEITAKTSKIP